MLKWLFIISIGFTVSNLTGQDNTMELPYIEIPSQPEMYTEQSVVSRMIDGLGYRFYWATEALREEDINYKPEGEATKTVDETLDHMIHLSDAVKNACMGKPIVRPVPEMSLNFEEKRALILNNLKEGSDALKTNPKPLEELEVIFKRGDQEVNFPFWNLINGQLSDAIYHTGQIVSYRRSSGNPMDPLVNVFRGKNRAPKE